MLDGGGVVAGGALDGRRRHEVEGEASDLQGGVVGVGVDVASGVL